MKIAILVEGKTETAFKPHLQVFLSKLLVNRMPRLHFFKFDGRVPTGEKLKRTVQNLLANYDHVIALTDVYTGTNDFANAEDAKHQMRKWVGTEERFSPHVALHDFEAWLLPYWAQIRKLANSNRTAPAGKPETVNHSKSPAFYIKEVFRTGSGRAYIKARDAKRILANQDLGIAIAECLELKLFINNIIKLSGGNEII